MKGMIKFISGPALVIAAMLMAGSPVYAGDFCGGDEGGKHFRGKGDRMEKLVSELGLTDEQRDSLKADMEKNRERAMAMREEIKAKREELRAELDKAEVDRGKVDGIVDNLTNLYKEGMDQRVESILSMKQILTPEQFQKLQQKKEEHMKNMRDKMKEKMGRHGGPEDEHGGPPPDGDMMDRGEDI